MPVRVGIPGDRLAGLSDSVRRPQFATATGLVLFGAQHVIESGMASGFNIGEGVGGKLVAWLKEFF